jgi:hypothetical protein
VEFNVHHGETTGATLVFYGIDGQGEWHILGGADPETLIATQVAPISGNSIDRAEPFELSGNVTIPAVDPQRPETDIQLVIFSVEFLSHADPTVSPDPTHSDFGLP